MDKPQCLFILGPTASGKTDLAVNIAREIDASLISVDSALIYRHMNIGTAKPDTETLKRFPHELVDLIEPDQAYSVARFILDAKAAMQRAVEAGKLPILVGGTMLYFKALLDGLSNLPSANMAERKKIEQQAAEYGWPAMHAELAKLDAEAAAKIDINHSQRICRALEVCRSTGMRLSDLLVQPSQKGHSPISETFSVCQIGLEVQDRALLHDRINRRFEQMLADGLIEEVKSLLARYPLTLQNASMRCVGYRQVWQHLQGEFDRDELLVRGQAATRQLAKRQLTWMRNWPDLHPLPVLESDPKKISNTELTKAALHCLNRPLC